MTTVAERVHKVLAERRGQIHLNILAWKGGRPYVHKRLWRAPNESDLSWYGTRLTDLTDNKLASPDRFCASGRIDRAALINDAGRVVSKITQYLFKRPAERTNIDADWARDVTGCGKSVGNFWVEVSELLTAGQWVWLQADRLAPATDPSTGCTRQRTLLEKQTDGDTVRWTAWPSICVPDWSFGPDGALRWIITEGSAYENEDPNQPAQSYRVRTLWQKTPDGYQTSQHFVGRQDGVASLGSPVETKGADRLPFVLLGTPSVEPWWFDDVEGLQAQLLNLDSLHFENLGRTVFPQLVIPRSTLDHMEMRIVERIGAANGQKLLEVVRELVRGLDSPIIEASEENGITRFIQPTASDQETIPKELARKRALLFDMVGLSLFNKETRQIQTAESKQFDQLDTESTLKHRSQIMQTAEESLVALSKVIDPLFKVYAPIWPASFDVVDISADSAATTMLSNMPGITPAMQKLALMSALRILSETGGCDQSLIEQARLEISRLTFDDSAIDTE